MSTQLRETAVALYAEGLNQITPEYLMQQALKLEGDSLEIRFLDRVEKVKLSAQGRMYLLSVGKAAAPMAMEAGRLLGDRVANGFVVTKEGFSMEGLPYPVRETGHPVPDEAGAKAADEVEAFIADMRPDDLLLVLMSGGASALLPAPLKGISLAEKQELVSVMLRTNMDIHEINMVRKAVSRFKGGGLAALASPALTLGLCLSDVPGDNLSSIGSGPSVSEPVDFPSVIKLLEQKGIWNEVPPAVRTALEKGQAAPKVPAKPAINGLIGTNRHLLRAMEKAAANAGFATRVIETPTTGLNPEALPLLLDNWRAYCQEKTSGPIALISGGETTVEVKGGGMGGRCQELAALMLPRMADGEAFLAAGSDGNDGPTDAAGGVVDQESWQRIQKEAIAYQALLDDNDSYHLLEQSGNLIKVPPTRNNVMDVHLFLRKA